MPSSAGAIHPDAVASKTMDTWCLDAEAPGKLTSEPEEQDADQAPKKDKLSLLNLPSQPEERTSISSDNSSRYSSDAQTNSTGYTSVQASPPSEIKETPSPLPPSNAPDTKAETSPPKEGTHDVTSNTPTKKKGGKEARAGITIDGKKRYPCTFPGCDKTFSTSGHSSRHSRIHTGEKPYRCTFPNCNAQFSRYDNSLQHYRTHIISSKSGKRSKEKGNARVAKQGTDASAENVNVPEAAISRPSAAKEEVLAYSHPPVPIVQQFEPYSGREYYDTTAMRAGPTGEECTQILPGVYVNSYGDAMGKKQRSITTEATMGMSNKITRPDMWPDAHMGGMGYARPPGPYEFVRTPYAGEAHLVYAEDGAYAPPNTFMHRVEPYIPCERKRFKSDPGTVFERPTNAYASLSSSGVASAGIRTHPRPGKLVGSSTFDYGRPRTQYAPGVQPGQRPPRPMQTRDGKASTQRSPAFQIRKSGSMPSLLSLDIPHAESSHSLCKYSLHAEPVMDSARGGDKANVSDEALPKLSAVELTRTEPAKKQALRPTLLPLSHLK